jgi:succinoglycan biosynthesis transport protein ExoP
VNESTPLTGYLAAAKRQWWVILQAVVVVAIVAAWFASREPDPPYRASTVFLVRPEYDASGRLLTTIDIGVAAEARNIVDEQVLTRAASMVPGETIATLRSSMSVSTDPKIGTMTVTIESDDPSRPVPVVTALAEAFVQERRNDRTASLQKLVEDYDGQLADLEARIGEVRTQIFQATAEGRDTSTLVAKSDALTAQYNATVNAQQEARSDLQLAEANVEVLAPALGFWQPEKPSPLERAAIGAGIGLLIGLALAAFRESLDTRVRSRDAVETTSGIDVIAELPEERIHTKRHELPTLDQPGGALAEAVRGLRTTLRYLGTIDPIRSLVVTSPQPGDGKTVTAANLAASYAASGVSTILVSADLRRPAADDLFEVSGMVGLSDVLAGTWPGPVSDTNGGFGHRAVMSPGISAGSIEPLLRHTPVPGLRMLPAGRVPPNPAELLASEQAPKVFAALGELAEMVIVDSPPTVVADGTLLAGLVDGVVLVVSLDHTRRSPLRGAKQALDSAHARVLGIVLNRVHGKEAGYVAYYRPRPQRRGSRRARANS